MPRALTILSAELNLTPASFSTDHGDADVHLDLRAAQRREFGKAQLKQGIEHFSALSVLPPSVSCADELAIGLHRDAIADLDLKQRLKTAGSGLRSATRPFKRHHARFRIWRIPQPPGRRGGKPGEEKPSDVERQIGPGGPETLLRRIRLDSSYIRTCT